MTRTPRTPPARPAGGEVSSGHGMDYPTPTESQMTSEQRTAERTGGEAAGSAQPAGTAAREGGRVPVNAGPGRLLLGIYLVFTVAAAARSAVQIATDYAAAPLAYTLSAAAAVVYGFITACLLHGRGRARTLAAACCVLELTGVVVVGLFSMLDPDAFPDATVWSDFGMGYLFIPVLLPVWAMVWLRRARRS